MKHSLKRNRTGMLLIMWYLSDSSQRVQGRFVLNTSGSVQPCTDATLKLTFQPDGTRETGRRTDRLQSAHCRSLQEHCQAPQQHDHTSLSSDPASACRGQHYTSLVMEILAQETQGDSKCSSIFSAGNRLYCCCPEIMWLHYLQLLFKHLLYTFYGFTQILDFES